MRARQACAFWCNALALEAEKGVKPAPPPPRAPPRDPAPLSLFPTISPTLSATVPRAQVVPEGLQLLAAVSTPSPTVVSTLKPTVSSRAPLRPLPSLLFPLC